MLEHTPARALSITGTNVLDDEVVCGLVVTAIDITDGAMYADKGRRSRPSV